MLRLMPTTAGQPPAGSSAAAGGHDAEPVEVRTGRPEGAGPPEQILWRGRLWLVRHAQRLGCPQQGERWVVAAGDGPAGPVHALELDRLTTGTWQLREDGA